MTHALRPAIRHVLTFCATLLLLATCEVAAADARAARPRHPPGTAIASAQAAATDAGFEAIAKGGNAFDAAVAVS